MPFKSKAQMRYMFAKHPEIAKRWVKKYGVPKDLPEKKANLIKVAAFYDELEKLGDWRTGLHRAIWRGIPSFGAALAFGYGLSSILRPMERELKKVKKRKGPRWKKELIKSKYLVPYALATGIGVTGLKAVAEDWLRRNEWLRKVLKVKVP